MSAEHSHAIVMTTTDSREEAQRMASALVAQKLAACVQVMPITSHYVWEGAATTSDELLLLIKTPATKVGAVRGFLEHNHSYATPEVIEVPIVSGLPSYLSWMEDVTTEP